MSEDYVIDVEGLTKSFDGPPVVNDLSIRVRRGRIYGFLGPNGSGKTTTIRMLCGLLTPDSGRGTCLGFDIFTQRARIKEQVGYMTQRFSLYADLTVRENLDFVARVYNLEDVEDVVDDIIEQVGLMEWSDHPARTLSGGWKQRLALSACMLHKPKLLLLDEPTAGVDPKARRDFWNEIHGLAEAGITVLVSTHYMDEAERCHELAYIFDGRLLTQGSAAEVTKRAGLTTWIVTRDKLGELEAELSGKQGIDIITPFADSLRISGHDAELLDATLAPYRSQAPETWERATPMLEDVFIRLMQSKDGDGA